MAKYKVGDLVRVIGRSSRYSRCHGDVLTISYIDYRSHSLNYRCLDKNGDVFWFSDDDITPADNPAPEITVNGAVYILKPKPKHVWKFGDWARDGGGGLGMVISCEHTNGCVWFLRKGYVDGKITNVSQLTYISTTEIPA